MLMPRFIFGSAEDRGKAQLKVAALIFAGILILVIPAILKSESDARYIRMVEEGEISEEAANTAREAVNLMFNGLQWIGIVTLAVGFVWAGISLKLTTVISEYSPHDAVCQHTCAAKLF